MRISFLVNEITGGWEPSGMRLGGTEQGVVEWAEELSLRGHKVIVFRNPKIHTTPTLYKGVIYAPREMYNGGGDVCINIKSPEVEPKEPTIFYTNDVDADKQDLSKYAAVIHISEWAKSNIPVNNNNVFIVPHGYDDSKIYPDKKIPKQCIYTSSPDRGLVTLLRAWTQVMEKHPDATLKVTYGAEPMDIDGVEFLGELTEEEMDKLYRESDIWCHPANGGELQCIAGLKAQAAGCWPVVIPTMALKETVKFGTFANESNYANKLIEALDEHHGQSLKGITIKESTDKLLEVIETVVK